MKLQFDVLGKNQPDPFIFEDEGRYYLYVTAVPGIEAYSADDIFGEWKYEGIVTKLDGEGYECWAPSIIKYEGTYYLYFSFIRGEEREFLYVTSAQSPLGPFGNEKKLYDYFSIDSHVVKTDKGLYLWYAKNSTEGERIGTRVFVDRLLDPVTPAGDPQEKIVPTFDEEIYTPSYREDFKWHTIEGPFWFQEGAWQYVMYSGGCYQDDTYHIGYAAAKTAEGDLTKVTYTKATKEGVFHPVLIKNAVEEGTGHHSVIKCGDTYYAIYHARDYDAPRNQEARTARVCKLIVENGTITAEPM